MVSTGQLQTLVEFVSDMPPILSVYLDVDPTRRTREEYRLVLRGLLKQAGENVADDDIQAVERFVDLEYDGAARGLAIFSCESGGLWEVFPLAVPVPDRVVVACRPYVTPLQEILDKYAGYAVVLVEREGARLFLFSLGELQEVRGTLGDQLKRHRQGGRSAPRIQRRADAAAQQNLRAAAEMTRAFCQEAGCSRLIVGGTADNIAAFRSVLPKAVRETIAGEMAMDTWAGEGDVRDKTMQIIREHMVRVDGALVRDLVTTASKGEAATIGLSATLAALQQNRAHMLVAVEGYESAGFACSACGYLAAATDGIAGSATRCPYCAEALLPTDNLVNAAVASAIGKGVSVKIVAGESPLREAGGIGAFLRY